MISLFAIPEMPGIKVGASEQTLQPGTYQVGGRRVIHETIDTKNREIGEGAGFKIPCPQYVAWDLDTTGRRLIDEICQVISDYLD